ncbi:activating signal cointegrator 1 complex subunit 2 homolog [Drosophila bipectinata]|uniref:activating signal cointegrator 1 complex subunit 2 homolog n=1 Tax=Drosophila bipectinata TaxID=42026 RepID=UPI001C8AF304|nr:activating signal cointegrator 1 complex subunit 2 homolog [Drosophila bipectinata]
MKNHRRDTILLVGLFVFLGFFSNSGLAEARRSGYRLPRLPQGRSASGSGQDVGSGRDLFKKFMLMRGMFQQPPSDNVIVISQPSTTTTTTTTPITTTTPSTTTTTTTTTNGTSRALNHNLGRQLSEPVQEMAVPTFTGLEDRLDLPMAVEESEPMELETIKQRKPLQLQPLFSQKKFKLRSLPSKNKNKKTKNVNRHQKIHHRRRFIQKKHRHQHQKKQKQQPSTNQHRSSESQVVDFIEPYHHDRSPSQTSQSGSESQLQRIWRRFQLAI